jgi:hypothetical protein
MMFARLESRWSWKPIPNCPGRYVLAGGPTPVTPAEVLAADVPLTEHVVIAAKDPVVVAVFADGGLISYRKPDGRFVHTLNSRDGLGRKLRELGIDLG